MDQGRKPPGIAVEPAAAAGGGGLWFDAVFQAAADCLLLVSDQGLVLRTNAPARRELFRSAEPPSGAELPDFIQPGDWEAFCRTAARPAGGGGWRGRWRWRLSQGAAVGYEVELIPLPGRAEDGDGNVMVRLRPRLDSRPDLGPDGEDKFSLAFSLSPVALGITSREDGGFLEVNEALCRLAGMRREEILGRSPRELGFWLDLGQRERFLAELEAQGGSIRNREVALRDRQGRTRQALLSAEVLTLGGQACLFMALMDLTEQRRATRLIQAQRDLALELAAASRPEDVAGPCLNTALDITGMDSGGIYLADPETGDFRLVLQTGLSDGFADKIGHRPARELRKAAVAGEKPYYWILGQQRHPGQSDYGVEGLKSVGLIPIHYEGRAVACLCVSSHRAMPIPEDARRALETIAAHLGSVIARSQAEQALRTSEAHLRSLFTNARDFAVYRLKSDPSGDYGLKVVFASPSLKKLLGIDNPQDLLEWGKNVHPDDLPRVLEANQRAFETRRFEAKARVLVPGENQVRWVRGVSSGVVDPRDGIHYINGMIIDISQNEQAREALDAYQARLRALALQLSRVEENQRRALAMDLHDGVGQLLAAAKLRLQDVMAFQAGPDLAEPLGEVRGLIEQMISLTRSVTAELSPPVLHDLGLEAALEWLAERTEAEHGLAVDLSFRDRPIAMDDDMRVILFRAVRELVHNVVKHAGASRAGISIELSGDRVLIRISDDGVGFVNPELAERAAEGRGFGLFSIRDRMEYLGGAMRVEPSPGRGAAVTLIAPTRLRSGGGR